LKELKSPKGYAYIFDLVDQLRFLNLNKYVVPQLETPLKPSQKMGYRSALDGIRALAIGLVLLEHTGLDLFDGGNSGVILFFVLSGFLITKLMIEEWDRTKSLDIKAFYGRRSVRILPAVFALVTVVFILSFFLIPDFGNRKYLWFELFMVVFYLTNLRPILFGNDGLWGSSLGTGERFMAHTWTLSVEEHFYIFWPWFFKKFKLPTIEAKSVVKGLVAGTLSIAVFRFILAIVFPDLVSISIFSFDGFALGACLAFVIHNNIYASFRRLIGTTQVFVISILILITDLFLRDQGHDNSGSGYFVYTFVIYCSIATVALIAHLYDNPNNFFGKLFSLKPVVYIGKLSYSIYLWHIPIQVYFSQDRFPEWSLLEIIVVEQVLTIGFSIASYKLVEIPANRFRKKFVVK